MFHAERSVDSVLRLIRDQLGMDVAFLAVVRNGRRTFRSVSSSTSATVVPAVGDWDRYEESLCQLIVDESVPHIIPDTSSEPLLARFPAVLGGHVGAHVGVPVRDPDGKVYGTLCAFSAKPSLTLRTGDSAILAALADVLYEMVITEDDEARARDQTATLVQTFLTGDGLALAAQPIVSLAGPRPDGGAEVLSRFQINGVGAAPDEVFERAHRTGLGNQLEVHVFERALALREHGQPVAVNLSASAIMSAEFAAAVRRLGPRDLPMLTIEITEHEPVEDYAALLERLAPLRAHGLLVAVDDLGAGFASMRHAIDLAADIVKIDRQLISNLHLAPRQRAIVAGIMTYATQTGTRVIAEGIETPDELRTLQDLGVAWGQGYLLGRPTPITPNHPNNVARPCTEGIDRHLNAPSVA